jgi:GT2 family glycosyltransferase
MLSSGNSVCILTVTYGNRWQFLQQILARVTAQSQVTHVIVVDNASTYSVISNVNELSDDRITVITNAENKGSAGGYKMAMEYAITHTDADLFWLIDDDNLPDTDALPKLLTEWQDIDGADNRKALFCLREDRVQHIQIAKGEDPYRYYLVPNNFLGFNIFRIIPNQFKKLVYRFNNNQPYHQRVKMPYVPYGGLLLHRAMVQLIGYPNEAFFLYVDDSEYTYRITKSGGTIWLIPACKIVDIDKSQGIGYKPQPFHSHLLDKWSFRTYYHVRNRMRFYADNFITNTFVFKTNKTLYLIYLKTISLLSSKRLEYKKLVAAVNDGLSGKLGKATENKF